MWKVNSMSSDSRSTKHKLYYEKDIKSMCSTAQLFSENASWKESSFSPP